MFTVVDMKTPYIRRLDFPYQYARQLLLPLKQELEDIQTRQFDRQRSRAHQLKQLRQLLTHAYQSCPYYTRVLNEAGVLPDNVTTLDDLQRIPLLPRPAVREHFYDLCSDQFDLTHCYIKSTSGSTGQPVRIVLGYSINMHWNVLLLNFIQPYGLQPDDFRPLRTGIVFVTAFPTSTSFTYFPPLLNFSRFYKLSLHESQWDSPHTALEFLSQRQPLLITGMPEHLSLLREMIESADPDRRFPIRPRLLLISGNKLYPKTRQALETHFQVPVVDIYALTEFGYLAVQCHTGAGYHVDDSLILEIVRADGSPAQPGETGEIVVTSLRNRVMPLIRYRTGDFGRLAAAPCPCGSHWPLLAAIEGRTNEFFVKADGSLLNPFVFIKHLDKMPLVQYQITQRSVTEIEVKYIPRYNDEMLEANITQIIRTELDPSIQIKVEPVAQIGDPGRKVYNFRSQVPNPFQV